MARQSPAPASEPAAAQASAEPVDRHTAGALEETHPAPVDLTGDGPGPAGERVAAAQAELDAARAAAAAQLPAGGYVIAVEALYVEGGARAHRPGDRVPVGNVVRNGWEHLVRAPEPDQ